MKSKAIQSSGFICTVLGILGFCGVIEHNTGLIQSLALLLSGTLILYRTYRENETNWDENGSSYSKSAEGGRKSD